MLKRNGVDMNRVCIIFFNPHIEILLAPQENNPLEYLRTHDRYEKSDLPKRIRNIDWAIQGSIAISICFYRMKVT